MLRMLALLGGLSGATDLATGAPIDESLKRCLVAIRLARAAGCADSEVADVMYTALRARPAASCAVRRGSSPSMTRANALDWPA